MNAENPSTSLEPIPAPSPGEIRAAEPDPGRPVSRRMFWAVALVALLALGLSLALWWQLDTIQQQAERRSASNGNTAIEARTLAREAQEQMREALARQTLMETRLNEVALQRSQLQDLMQSLTRSRDENMVFDIESAIRLAQQQAQLTGSVEPLLAALKSAQVRVNRAAQPRLAALQQAIARDLDRVRSTTVSDTPTLLVKLDEVVVLADDLPLSNALAGARGGGSPKLVHDDPALNWWQRVWLSAQLEMRSLVRVSRIDQPEAALLSPEQAFFLRENFKLRLLNARLGLLARQMDASRADLVAASGMIAKYFDPSARRTQLAAALLQQMQASMKSFEMPRVDATLAALTTAAAGK